MRRTRLMGVLTVVGIVVLAVAVVALIARFVPGINVAVVATAALAPYLMLGAPLAMIVLAVSRTWIAVAVAGVVTVATIAVQLPWYTRRRVEPGVVVRVVSANLRYGRADPEAVVRMARDHADILAVQELTPEKAELISAAGMDTVLPYQVLRARKGPDGVGIWSRFPMRRGAEYDEFGRGLLTTQVQIPEVAGEATVIAAHMSAPYPDPLTAWRVDLARLDSTLQEIGASADGPVMLAADLNATPDNLEFRRLLHGGYRDAAEQAGAGLTRTYKSHVRPLPPVFALDHILTRDCVATSVRTLTVPETDHQALLAEITIFVCSSTHGSG
jgi:endonuclease/exonuclease/phosphatase (EEP) superfamily protein YafD